MGLLPNQVQALLFKDFVMMYEGYQRRLEEQWDMVRHQMWATISFGGMGTKNPITVQDIVKLKRDRGDKKSYISSKAEAIMFIKSF